jgi:hypothetical protein
MYEAYEFYKDCEYEIPRLLIINNFIKKNYININNIVDVFRHAKNMLGLQLHISILKYEIEQLKETKNGHSLRPLQQVGPLPRYYNW